MKTILSLVILFAASHTTFAAEQTYSITTPVAHKTGIEFKIPYTMGTHEGEAQEVRGSVILDLVQPSAIKGSFLVPIQGLKTGNNTRDCHLVEALGINYTQSKFPKDHVCDSDDKLPIAGPDSVVYPNVEFKVTALQLTDGKITSIDGEWTIHGVTLPAHFAVKVTTENEGFRLEATTQLSLEAFQVKVKPATALGVVISTVRDTVTVILDLHFQAVK